MFTERSLSGALADVHTVHAPDTLVLDCTTNFETLPPAQAEDLGLLVDALDPFSCPDDWLPPDAPAVLDRYAGPELTIGMPGDGSVAWTRQTDPPVVICKPRLDDSPAGFADFLLAEALVEVGLDEPEHCLGFFGTEYPEFDAAAGDFLGSVETYQVAVACYDASLGLQTRDTFAGWEGDLFDAWLDAGERLDDRLADLPATVARGSTSFADAAELACSAVKHAGDIPAPFDALDAAVYLDHGPAYAIEWLDRTVASLD
jgi:hypothetical protein